jgi:hypothetical protein
VRAFNDFWESDWSAEFSRVVPGWVITTITSGLNNTERVSIAIDSDNSSHISYCDTDSDTLNYSHWDGNSWETETVDTSNSLGKYNSIAVDSIKNPILHIMITAFNTPSGMVIPGE